MNMRIRSRQLALLLVLGLLLSLSLWSCATTGPAGVSGTAPGKAKNIVLLIGDGMGPGSERINGLLHNTQLFNIMKDAME